MDELTRLLVAGRDGDRDALAAAIRRSQADVWRLAAHLVGRDDADDVTQDVFLRAYRSLPGFRAESSGRTWLLTITRRACADLVRRTRRRRRLQDRLHSHHDGAVTPAADGAVGLDAWEAGQLRSLHAAYRQLVPERAGASDVMLFRLAVAERPTVRSLRLPVDAVLQLSSYPSDSSPSSR